ncbi:hypothetical protein FSS13T_00220 [Flavobacterium saliperosum S13]|uniref:Uncharacterized protein n=2 Tax=Flavobacterium saliperosum TaxID=329186 RepID=A0A1G4V1H4_9FLAO|nr:hypothetical protein [Flavobacterium saliperosum]ESU28563.1 hypothetical protein FSS13T_00220 [Flavobacterium saliperosum S13]SCW99761.1 hypothetical protein SAMN02927925_00022 [Flavobacterium saliperosum]
MNRIFKIFSVFAIAVLFANCQKDDGVGPVEARPHPEVYPEDLVKIEDYLHKYYVEVTKDVDGDVTSVVMNPLDATHTVSIWDQTEYPLLYKIVKRFGVDFKVYYLKFDGKGDTDADGDKPCGVDVVLTSYRGISLTRTFNAITNQYDLATQQFDYAPNPTQIGLADVATKGWEYIFPEFRAGYLDPLNGDGTLNSENYGSGVMFLPSGLGYYNQSFGNIPQYAPLIFTFNLHAVTYTDLDNDKIPSRYEYILNADGTLLDTDGDGIPNVFDADDDNDGYLTKDEIKKPTPILAGQGTSAFYPFNPMVDDPATVDVDETEPKGIPDASGDGTTTTRLRRHLDRTAKPPYTDY